MRRESCWEHFRTHAWELSTYTYLHLNAAQPSKASGCDACTREWDLCSPHPTHRLAPWKASLNLGVNLELFCKTQNNLLKLLSKSVYRFLLFIIWPSVVFIYLFIYFWYLGLNSGPCTHHASTLPFNPHPSLFCFSDFSDRVSGFCLSWPWTSILLPSHLYLLSS
jgi:hypothetical protein